MSLLGSIGSIAGGVSSGLSAEAQQALQRYAAQAARQSLQGQAAAGDALSGYTGQGAPLGALAPSPLSSPQAPQQSPPTPVPASAPQAIQAYAPQTGQSGFPEALKFTLGQEGGLNPSDTNNTPTNFGINQAANPDVNVQALTPQTAAPIYKQRYWDAIGGDQLPPQLQKMAFDTAVMSGPQIAKAMLQASGGDPQRFMQLRQAFQSKLLQAEPDKYGKYAAAWAERNKALAGGQPSPQQGGGTPGQPPMPGVPSVAAIQQMPLQDIVQLVRRNNPNLRGGALLDAVKSIQGVMNPEAQMQLRLIQAQLAATKAQEQFYLGNRRADTAQESVQERERHDQQTEGLSEEKMSQQAAQFKERQKAVQERFDASLKEKYDAIAATDKRADKNRLAADARSAIKDQLAAERKAK